MTPPVDELSATTFVGNDSLSSSPLTSTPLTHEHEHEHFRQTSNDSCASDEANEQRPSTPSHENESTVGGAGSATPMRTRLQRRLSGYAKSLPDFVPPPSSWVRGYFFESSWEQLNSRPTITTILICMCVFLPVTLALQWHVLDTTSHLALFFGGSVVVLASYYIAHRALMYWSTSFGRLTHDKQIYAVSNLLKASVLASITPIAVYQLTRIVVHDRWDSNTLRNIGCIYAIPDAVALLVVRRMAATTVVHHLCVVLFNFISMHNDYTQDNVCRLIVVYGAFSTFGYVVYLLLASRFLGVSPVVSRHLSAGALVVYVVCCGINWTWQAWYLRKLLLSPADADGGDPQQQQQQHNKLAIIVYMAVVSFVMYDDLNLNRWLLQNVRTRTHHQQQVAQSVLLRREDDERAVVAATATSQAKAKSASPAPLRAGSAAATTTATAAPMTTTGFAPIRIARRNKTST